MWTEAATAADVRWRQLLQQTTLFVPGHTGRRTFVCGAFFRKSLMVRFAGRKMRPPPFEAGKRGRGQSHWEKCHVQLRSQTFETLEVAGPAQDSNPENPLPVQRVVLQLQGSLKSD